MNIEINDKALTEAIERALFHSERIHDPTQVQCAARATLAAHMPALEKLLAERFLAVLSDPVTANVIDAAFQSGMEAVARAEGERVAKKRCKAAADAAVMFGKAAP